ncbi:MAG: hypothetical protein ACFCGT_28085 [Sandaracinaceae bacterium]
MTPRALLRLTPLLLVAAGGCSLLWGPGPVGPTRDGGLPPPTDGGPDADQDGGPPICIPTQPAERTCVGGDDEDCDELIDCADFDCAGDLDCCVGGDATVEDWRGSLAGYDLLPRARPLTEDDFVISDVVQGARWIREFPPGIEPKALWSQVCTPLAFGARITATFLLDEQRPCVGGSCPYASVVLTRAADMSPGDPLLSELAVRLLGTGEIELWESTTRFASSEDGEGPTFVRGEVITVTIGITPGIDGDRSALFLFVLAEQEQPEGPPRSWTYARAAQWPASVLEAWGRRCREIGAEPPDADGLFLAFEGRGDDVWLGPTSVQQQSCANPSYLEAPRPEDRDVADELSLAAGWSTGGGGAPTLASFTRAGEGERWELWVDGADDERSDELLGDPTFEIGGLVSGRVNGLTGFLPRLPTTPTPPRDGRPLLGDDLPNYREPFLLAVTDDRLDVGDSSLRLVYAAEDPPDPTVDMGMPSPDGGLLPRPPAAYALYGLASVPWRTDAELQPPDLPLLHPEDVPGCAALREPSLVPMDAGRPPAAFFLFFSCADGSGVDRIFAVPVDRDLTTADLAGLVLVLGPEPDGYSEDGVSSPEVLAEFPADGEVIYRMWYLADGPNGRTVAFAEARGSTLEGALPAFAPYPGNPILAADASVLGEPCAGCFLSGLAATRSVANLRRYRLMVSRAVPEGEGLRHELLPLDQIRPLD